MDYLLLIVAVLVARFSHHPLFTRGQQWCHGWFGRAVTPGDQEQPAMVRFYGAILIPVMALFMLINLLQGSGHAWLANISILIFLLFSFDFYQINQKIEVFVADLKRDDLQAAFHDAEALSTEKEIAADDWQGLHQSSLSLIGKMYFERYFPVIFWYTVGGVAIAFLYRLLYHFSEDSGALPYRERLQRMLKLLEWLPLRLVGLSYALLGNWNATFPLWLNSLKVWSPSTESVMQSYISGSIESPAERDSSTEEIWEIEELGALVDRALILWLAVLGILTIL